MSNQNLHPSTPFGIFFNNIGLWHPHFDKGIVEAYNQLHDAEKAAIADASGVIAVANKTIGQTPEFVWNALSKVFPAITKEAATDFLNKLNQKLQLVDSETPADFDSAITALQNWLSKFSGAKWAEITRVAVVLGATILKEGLSLDSVVAVLEFVYQFIIKPKIG